MPIISEETRITFNLIDKFGALTVDQINKLFEGKEFNPRRMMAFMRKNRMTQFLDDNFVVLENRLSYAPETLYCVWVMLDKIKAPYIAGSQEIKSANPCDNGVEICFINDGSILEYITFIDNTSIFKVSMIQDTFYTSTGVKRGEEDKCRRLYTFVVKDEEVMDILADMELTIPFMIAFVEGDLNGVPSVEYYK